MQPLEVGTVGTETVGTGETGMVLREDVLRLLCVWRMSRGGGHGALTAVTLTEWVQLLGGLAARLDQPVAATVEAPVCTGGAERARGTPASWAAWRLYSPLTIPARCGPKVSVWPVPAP
jgi:hypothetical protein